MWCKNTPKIYYKVLSKDSMFEIGQTYKHTGKIKLGKSGFHCCKNILECLQHYPLKYNIGFYEITIGKSKNNYNETVTNKMTIVREIVGEELNNMLTGVYTEYHTICGIPYLYQKIWYKNGVKHRDGNEPAIIRYDEYENITAKFWYKNGKLYCIKEQK